MSLTIETTLALLFAHPTSEDIPWQSVAKLFARLGATLESDANGDTRVHLHGKSLIMHVPQSGIVSSENQVQRIRDFLQTCGISEHAS